MQWESLEAEVEGLAQHINRNGDETFLALVPRRFIGYRLAELVGGDAKTDFSEEVLEHPVAQEAFTGASLLADPEDWVAARVWPGFRGEDHTRAPRRNAGAYASLPQDVGGHELIRRIANGEIKVTGTGSTHVKTRARKAWNLIEHPMDPIEIVDTLFDPSLSCVEPDVEKQRWLKEDLQELQNAAKKALAAQDTPDLSRVLSTIRYRIATRASLTPDESEARVRIMTLHSAKGLEADNVVISGVTDQFMTGLEEDLAAIEEQRRLLYVALTRAKDSLIISWSRRFRFDDAKQNRGSAKKIFTIEDVKQVTTTRSRLLPQGLGGVISGKEFLKTTV